MKKRNIIESVSKDDDKSEYNVGFAVFALNIESRLKKENICLPAGVGHCAQ